MVPIRDDTKRFFGKKDPFFVFLSISSTNSHSLLTPWPNTNHITYLHYIFGCLDDRSKAPVKMRKII